MTLLRTFIAVLFFATLFAASSAWTHVSARRNAAALQPALVSETTSVLDDRVRVLHDGEDDWSEPRVDLNGNEVDAAVGDYRVDRHGEMYERHAPDTALLHLSSPKL